MHILLCITRTRNVPAAPVPIGAVVKGRHARLARPTWVWVVSLPVAGIVIVIGNQNRGWSRWSRGGAPRRPRRGYCRTRTTCRRCRRPCVNFGSSPKENKWHGASVVAELIVFEIPAKEDDARRRLSENLSRGGVKERRGRGKSGTGEGEEGEWTKERRKGRRRRGGRIHGMRTNQREKSNANRGVEGVRGGFLESTQLLPLLSIQDDIAATLTGDVGAGLVFERGEGSNMGLGVSRKDMLTSSDDDGFGDEVRALLGVISSSSVVNTCEFRLCTRQLRLLARESEGAVATVVVSLPDLHEQKWARSSSKGVGCTFILHARWGNA